MNATFFIVGVSDAVEDLLHGHESIGRALSQVEMPRMSDSEIIDIIYKRLRRAGIRITQEAIWDCVFICKGLPHHAHLLGLHAMQAACDRRSLQIERKDIDEAAKRALADANQSIRAGFEKAVYSERPDNIFKQVLVACALAQRDSLGQFSAKAVATILSEITDEIYDVPAFSYHLNEFCEPSRGPILKKIGQTRRFMFRFVDALMESYSIMEGMNRKIITPKWSTRIDLSVSPIFFTPPSPRGFFCDLCPPSLCHGLSARPASLSPERDCGGVFPVVWGHCACAFLNLPGGDLGNHDGGADHVGWALLAFRASGHSRPRPC